MKSLKCWKMEDFTSADVYLAPPDGDSDGDSADEDGGTFDNLTTNQLNAAAEAVVHRAVGEDMRLNEDSDTQTECPRTVRNYPRTNKNDRRWRKQDIQSTIGEASREERRPPKFLSSDLSPCEIFQFFFDDEMMEFNKEMSETYAKQKGDHTWTITYDELCVFIGILLLSGYVPLPRKRMYWEQSDDCHNVAVANSMSRGKFDDIFKYLHLSDNSKMDPKDRAYKIRAYFSMLNEKCLCYMPPSDNMCVDETMIPYYGRHPSKQFIRGKPVRYGFKLWTLASSEGYVIQFQPYTGASSSQTNLGLGPSVVLDLISELEEPPHHLSFDNFFTTLPLLEELGRQGVQACGTIRTNRVDSCPLKDQKTLKTEPRGSMDYRLDSTTNILVVEWNDNNIVTMATNADTVLPSEKVKRWGKKERAFVDVGMPKLVKKYNQTMGGVDQADQNIAQYRVAMRLKKWWWPFFSYSLDMAMQNAWMLYRKTEIYKSDPLDLLGFWRMVVRTLLMRHQQGIQPVMPRRPQPLKRKIPADVRYDGKDHFMVDSATQKRCASCGKNTRKFCRKCGVGLHAHCFNAFHGVQ